MNHRLRALAIGGLLCVAVMAAEPLISVAQSGTCDYVNPPGPLNSYCRDLGCGSADPKAGADAGVCQKPVLHGGCTCTGGDSLLLAFCGAETPILTRFLTLPSR